MKRGHDRPVPRPESTGPATDRVRIVGAEPAGESTADGARGVPAREPAEDGPGRRVRTAPVRLTDEPAEAGPQYSAVQPVNPGQTAVPGGGAATTELPHWTEPPTGQVPAVLARDTGGEGSGSGIASPSWREEDADWTAHDEEFEPAMFGDDRVALGSLDETEGSDADRRPWEFDLDSVRTRRGQPRRSVRRTRATTAPPSPPSPSPPPWSPRSPRGPVPAGCRGRRGRVRGRTGAPPFVRRSNPEPGREPAASRPSPAARWRRAGAARRRRPPHRAGRRCRAG